MTSSRLLALESALKARILILDGAMGTMIQAYKLGEVDYRGERFKDFEHDRGPSHVATVWELHPAIVSPL